MNKEKGSYIYLYRKILNNKTLFRDTNAFTIFIWLLLRANYKTGEIETGRFAMANDLGIKPCTIYSSLLRLSRNYKLLNIKSNNKYSIISIVNWHDFQGSNNTSDNIQITTRSQQDNTIQGSKGNKEIKTEIKKKSHMSDLEKINNPYKGKQ